MKRASLVVLLLTAFFVACGDEESSSGASSTPAAADTSTDSAPATDAANGEASENDCTARGYECHLNPTCNAEFMPMSAISCGAGGGYCCVKGALPPGDASTGG